MWRNQNLEEESEDLSSQMFSSGLFMVHDAAGCGHDDVPELTRGQQVVGPLLDVGDSNVKPGRDDATLVESAGEIDDDFAATVVVDDFELADVASVFYFDFLLFPQINDKLKHQLP